MIIKGKPNDTIKILKNSIDTTLNPTAMKQDTDSNTQKLEPPINFTDCFTVYRGSLPVFKCCDILAVDTCYKNCEISSEDNKDYSEINKKINKQIPEITNAAKDYFACGFGAVEYVSNNDDFIISQIPSETCNIIKIQVNKEDCYLLEQKIGTNTKYFKILGEEYPNGFEEYDKKPLSKCATIGGDNTYRFFTTPYWAPVRNKILTGIAIDEYQYENITNGNVASAILNISLPKQITEYDDDGNPKPTQKENMVDEIESTPAGGVLTLFSEYDPFDGNASPISFELIPLVNSNDETLNKLNDEVFNHVLKAYGIPKERLGSTDEKEGMNSNKTSTMLSRYDELCNQLQQLFEKLIYDIIADIYEIDNFEANLTDVSLSDSSESDIKNITTAFSNAGVNLGEYIRKLATLIDTINLGDYDLTQPIYKQRFMNGQPLGGYQMTEQDSQILDEVSSIETGG